MLRKFDLCTASGATLEVTTEDKNNYNQGVQNYLNAAPVHHPIINLNLLAQPSTVAQPQISPDKVTGRVFNK